MRLSDFIMKEKTLPEKIRAPMVEYRQEESRLIHSYERRNYGFFQIKLYNP